ncbi:MAG: glutamate-1-semialdehyde 2,1-aminomutase 2 [Candidatus Sericytochromatia bacterium]|nr:MAG: glutamate-1-semialdehyde 2,1-aminomutase 2 [Candidatus Sericytochromatia bacterium]
MKNTKSLSLFEKAKELIPGGVNSPVRAFKSVGGNPLFIKKAKGSRLIDEDNNKYIDYVCSWGPMILGHGNEEVLEAIHKQLEIGISYGTCSKKEIEIAELIIEAMPSIEMLRMVNSGTEATMSAIRLARAYTKKDKIIKFKGCYHGHGDMLLSEAGSGIATLGIPGSPGITNNTAKDTLTVDYNNIEQLKEVFETYPYDIACVIIEPVVGNMGVVKPIDNYLQEIRKLCDKYDTLLIFDEVMTGFRLAYGGAQEIYKVKPDLTCLGKIIGGGLPVGAYGGRKDIMKMVAPSGPVYQAGTLSGNPLAMTAGLETLKIIRRQKDSFYKELDKKAEKIAKGIEEASRKYDIDICLSGIGSMLSIFFINEPVINYEIAKKSNVGMFNKFFHSMLEQGIYLPPSQFESWFISISHTQQDLIKTVNSIKYSFSLLRESLNEERK